METVKVSPKYQVVIPCEIRKSMGIKPGIKVQVIQYENRIEYIPLKKVKEMRGLPLADSVILATAKIYDSIVWTQDVDFKGLMGVKYFKK